MWIFMKYSLNWEQAIESVYPVGLSLYFVFSEVLLHYIQRGIIAFTNPVNTLQMYLLNLQMETTNFSQLVLEKEMCT